MTKEPDDIDDLLSAAKQAEKGQTSEYERKLFRLQARAREAQAAKKHLLKEIEIVEARHDFLCSIEGPVKAHTIKPAIRGKKEACAVAIASDWHVGELVDPITVNDRNSYNPEIAQERGLRYFRNVLRLLEQQRSGATIKTMVLGLLGDMMTGYIHEELVETNPLSPTEEILLLKEMLVSGIDFLLEHGGLTKIVIPCCYGNHGRTTLKRRVQSGAKNSYEWLLYKVLEGHYEKEDRIEFIVADGSHVYVEVFGVMIRFHHGDDVRFQGGVGGLSIPLRKACHGWDTFKPAQLTIIGHWHQFVDFGFAIVNGSLIGYNAYALSIKATFEEPRQAFFLIDKARERKTVVAPIFVEK